MTESENRRTQQRLRTLKGAHISYNGGFAAAECTVRNMSEGGALLEFPGILALPSEFTLHITSEFKSWPCKVAWRSGMRVGVTFTGPAVEKQRRAGPPPKRRDEGY